MRARRCCEPSATDALRICRGDADRIAKFLTDDYTLTNSKGEITTAADDIEDARSG